MHAVVRLEVEKLLPLVGALVISVAVLISYHPALPIGFWYDDYNHLEMVGRPALNQFLVNIFDPRAPRLWYRPFQQLQWRLEYTLWGGEATPYHVVQNLMHLIDCLLLSALITRLSRSWRAGFLGGLIYGVLPTYTLSVFWLGVPDPLVTIFYLLTLLLWIDYLREPSKRRYALTFCSFIATFLTKEIAVFLPILLLLVDRWLIGQAVQWRTSIRRSAPFFIITPFLLLLGWNGAILRVTGVSTGQADWKQFASNLLYYGSGLAWPWADHSPIKYVLLFALILLFIYAVLKRKYPILFLGICGLLTLIPNLNFEGVSNRHLYLSLMAPLAAVALLIESIWRWLRARWTSPYIRFALRGLFVLGLTALTMWQSARTAESAVDFSSLARQSRLQFRPIFQSHPAFEPDTLLYFIEPPFTSYNVSGLMFLRYGTGVSVRANDVAEYPNLRQSQHAYVFYPDEQNELRELSVDPAAPTRSSIQMPVQFGANLTLEGYEVVSTQAKSGGALVLLLDWRASGHVDRNYTVFAHLVDEQGNIVASHDSEPQRGAAPTSSWAPSALIVDAVILPITGDTPVQNNYRIELGMYYLPTLERLRINDQGQATDRDTVVIGSFAVVP